MKRIRNKQAKRQSRHDRSMREWASPHYDQHMRLRKIIEREEVAHLWGQPHRITPRLCTHVFGDGMQLLLLEPIDTRPNYYVVRIDSTWELSNWYDGPKEQLCGHLDEIYDAIEDDFGPKPECECDGVGSDDCPSCNGYFPIPFLDNGCSWGTVEIGDREWWYVLFGVERRQLFGASK